MLVTAVCRDPENFQTLHLADGPCWPGLTAQWPSRSKRRESLGLESRALRLGLFDVLERLAEPCPPHVLGRGAGHLRSRPRQAHHLLIEVDGLLEMAEVLMTAGNFVHHAGTDGFVLDDRIAVQLHVL